MPANRTHRSTTHSAPRSRHFSRRRTAVAAAALCLSLSPVWAGITTTGSHWADPFIPPNYAGTSVLPNTSAGVGNGSGGIGSLLVDAGSFLQLATLSFGTGGGGVGTGVFTGAGTRVELVGSGVGNQTQRLQVGNYGMGQLAVNAGAIVDTRGNPAPCLIAFHYCDSFVGSAAGDTAVLNIDGIGTQVNIGKSLFVAAPGLARPDPVTGWAGWGIPGGTTRGTVNVTGGALLSTDFAEIAPRHWSTDATGHESNIGEVNVSGPGSRWVVTGGNQVNHSNGTTFLQGAYLGTANDRNAWATLNVSAGGTLQIDGPYGVSSGINLTNGGGRTDMLVTGAGSTVAFTGDSSYFQVGRRLGSAYFALEAGASVTGVQYVSVGRDGSFGEMMIDGMGTVFSATGIASAAANGGFVGSPTFDIGRDGTGVVTVRNGARLEVMSSQTAQYGPSISMGKGVASSGTLNITGPGSVVQISAASIVPGGGPTEAFNTYMGVGREGNGALNITNGGKLFMDGYAVSNVANPRGNNLIIGGLNANQPGGKGIANVTGLGSEIRLSGSDTYIMVGQGPQSFGQFNLSDRATVSAMNLMVGNAGGTGLLKMDNSTVTLTGSTLSNGYGQGGFMSLGRGGGVGVATITNGSVINITNMGSDGAGLYLGGTGGEPTGDGNLTVSGGSHINIQAAPGLGTFSVGRDGSALVRVKGGSSINVGDGNTFVARLKGSDGTMILSEGSSLTTGFLGVGRNKTATGTEDGGTGTVVLVHSTLNAQEIVIGTNGFLGGSGTITGNVTNYGTFAPGNSPGTLEIDGAFVAAAGSRMILEVESDGHGGFNTDHIIFKNGQTLDLSQLNAEFRFLGATDPNSFKAQSLFNVDTFFQMRQADNSLVTLDRGLFNTAVFTASAEAYTITNFSFNTATGATFIAAAVPEPGEWAMMLAGLLVMGAVARRRNASSATSMVKSA